MEIIITNIQKSGSEKQEFTQKASCRYMEKGGVYYILYSETEESLAGDVKTKIKAEKNTVTITRTGGYINEMVYKENSENTFLYKMPYGAIEMTLKTHTVKINLDESGGSIELSYTLSYSGEKNQNSIIIQIS